MSFTPEHTPSIQSAQQPVALWIVVYKYGAVIEINIVYFKVAAGGWQEKTQHHFAACSVTRRSGLSLCCIHLHLLSIICLRISMAVLHLTRDGWQVGSQSLTILRALCPTDQVLASAKEKKVKVEGGGLKGGLGAGTGTSAGSKPGSKAVAGKVSFKSGLHACTAIVYSLAFC